MDLQETHLYRHTFKKTNPSHFYFYNPFDLGFRLYSDITSSVFEKFGEFFFLATEITSFAASHLG